MEAASSPKVGKIRHWRRGERVARFISYVLCIFLAVVFSVPTYWAVTGSFKTVAEIQQIPPIWLPETWHWENYKRVWELVPFGRFLFNTVLVTLAAGIGQVLTAAIVGYGFARFRFRGREILFMMILATIMFPPELTIIPTFIGFRKLGWIDTFWPLIVPYWFGGGAFFIFLFRQFFRTIPEDLLEAARLDGAGYWRIFWEIIVPLSKPAFASAAIISFITHWNDFFNPLIFLSSPSKFTLSLGIQAFATGGVGLTPEPRDQLLMAATVMMTAPVVAVFFFAQRYFIQGIATSGLKG
ncbi:MAG: carbohydrate ABC transporter permease [Thermomicrobiales bacterium]